MAPSVSCLVVSRTSSLLNRLLQSLGPSRQFWGAQDEVLCSWNGSRDDEVLIVSDLEPRFRIVSRTAYHFASNMNALAASAQGDILVFLNDDVVLDPGSLDRAIQTLCARDDIGLVGGLLRKSDGRVSHAGILFGTDHQPYNRLRPDRLGSLIDYQSLEVQESGPMPAVTGALMVITREDFLRLRFRETFRICGEDVALCLDVQDRLGKSVYYASDVTGIHDEKSTRGNAPDHFDRQQVANLMARLSRPELPVHSCLSYWALQEADLLERLVHQLRQDPERHDLFPVPETSGDLAARETPPASELQLRSLQQQLEAVQCQVAFLLRREARGSWLSRFWADLYRGFCSVGRVQARRS